MPLSRGHSPFFRFQVNIVSFDERQGFDTFTMTV